MLKTTLLEQKQMTCIFSHTIKIILFILLFTIFVGFGKSSFEIRFDGRKISLDSIDQTRFQSGLFLIYKSSSDACDLMKEIDKLDVVVQEPITKDCALVWIADETEYKRLENTLNPYALQALNPDWKRSPGMNRFDENPERAEKICFWIRDSQDTEGILTSKLFMGSSLRNLGSIRYSKKSKYRIYEASMNSVSITKLLKMADVRFVYPAVESAGFDDESTVIEVIRPYLDYGEISPLTTYASSQNLSGDSIMIAYIDSGFDTNSNLDCHIDIRGRIHQYLTYPGSVGYDYLGHGTSIGCILAGSGKSAVKDEKGYLLGLGAAQLTKLIVSDAAIAAPFPPTGGFPRIIADIANTPATICSNSWHDKEGIGIGYTANCAVWDAAVRDATFDDDSDPKPMAIFFSAGNFGPEEMTIGSPKEAKNIVTVGACGTKRGDSENEIWLFSSRGPCLDGRVAPTLAAPGVNVFSCSPGNLHFGSTGTSIACPHIASLGALMIDRFVKNQAHHPSPALLKSYLISLTQPMSEGFSDSAWGWGKLTQPAFDQDFSAFNWLDQEVIFESSADRLSLNVFVLAQEEPVDIVLSWTDAPASPFADPALVNDLDLIVEDGTTVYRGNVFIDGLSVPGGEPDRLNNSERVRLATASQNLTLTISAHAIIGDAIPKNDIVSDQDFAIYIRNALLYPESTALSLQDASVSCFSRIKTEIFGWDLKNQQTVSIHVRSTSDTTGVPLDLHENPAGSGFFEGWLETGDRISRGELFVQHHDKITASFQNIESSAVADCQAPRFERIEIDSLRADCASLRLTIDEPAKAVMHYGLLNASSQIQLKSPFLGVEHCFEATGLEPCTKYQAMIYLIDENGNFSSSYDFQCGALSWTTDARHIVHQELFDEDPEWEILEEAWQWGRPLGQGSPPDPDSGYTGENVLGYNLNGDYEPLMPMRQAISHPIDCSDAGDYLLKFYRWLGTESSLLDKASIQALNSASGWVDVWHNPITPVSDDEWTICSYDITSMASENANFQIRFRQGPSDPVGERCGWNIDDLSITRDAPCVDPTPPAFFGAEPHLDLFSNQKDYSTGDVFYLSADVCCPETYSEIGLGIQFSVDDFFFYFPGFDSTPQFAILSIKIPGVARSLIIDATLPSTGDFAFNLNILAVIFDTTTFEILGGVFSDSLTFDSSLADGVDKGFARL